MVESQIKLSERVLLNNPNIKTKSELELKADLIKEIEEQIKSLDHTGNGFGILVSNITGFVSGYNFLLNDYKKLLEQAKTSQLTYKQLNDQYLALGNRLSGVAETSDTWALGSQVVKSTTETASVLAGKAIGGVAGGTAAGTLTSGLNSLAGNATSASIGGDTFDPKKVGIETGQGFVKSAITAVSFKVGEVSGAASASALVKALPANSISPKILNLFGGTVGGFAGGGFGNGAGQINEMVMSKFGLGDKKEFDWNSFGLSLSFGGLGGAVGSQFGHSVPAVIADGLTGAGLGLGELAANNGGSLQGISREEFANTIAQSLVNPFIGKAVAHHNYSNPESLIKSPEAVSSLTKENTKELLKIANEHTLNNNPEKYIEFMTNFVENATDEQLDNIQYDYFNKFSQKVTNKEIFINENMINKIFKFLEVNKSNGFDHRINRDLFTHIDLFTEFAKEIFTRTINISTNKSFELLEILSLESDYYTRGVLFGDSDKRDDQFWQVILKADPNRAFTLLNDNYKKGGLIYNLRDQFHQYPTDKLNIDTRTEIIKSLAKEMAEGKSLYDPWDVRELAFREKEERQIFLDNLDTNTLKHYVKQLVYDIIYRSVHNGDQNEHLKLFLKEITSKLDKEEVVNIILENRKSYSTTGIDNLIIELGLITDKFLEIIEVEFRESLITFQYDNYSKKHSSNIFNILMAESQGIYLKDLFVDKDIYYSERVEFITKILENNIQSLDYLKPKDFDSANLTDEQSQILYNNFKHIYKETKSTELISKLQPLTEKLFIKYNPDLLEKAKTNVVETMRNDDYSILNKAFPELEGIVKNGLEQYSINNPNRFFSLFSDDFYTYKSTGLNDFIKGLLIKVIKNSSDKLIGGDTLDLSSMTITEDLKIQGLVNLEKVNLSGSSLPKGFNLENLPNLKEVSLSYAEIPKGLNLKNLPNLESIDLSNAKLPKGLNLKNLPNLKSIYLTNATIRKGLKIQNLPNLESINLSYATILLGLNLKNLPNLESINLQNAKLQKGLNLKDLPNLKSIYLTNATISSESINIIDFLNPNNTELILKFLQSSLEVEDSYKAYKQVLQKNNNTEGLKEIVKNILLDYISTDQTDLKTLNILEKLYINSEINAETDKQSKAFPQIEKVLSQIRKENSTNNILNFVISTITDSNKLSRTRSINALNIIKLLPKTDQGICFSILSQSKNQERNNIIDNLASLNIGSKLSTNPSEILTKYLFSKKSQSQIITIGQ